MYACSEHTDNRVVIDDGYPMFAEMSQLWQVTYDKEKGVFGNGDILIGGDDIPSLKAQLEHTLKQKLQTVQVADFPSNSITLFGRTYGLDIRNDEHLTIILMAMMLDMAVTEIERGGAIWLYDLSVKKDEINSCMLSMIKSAPTGLTAEAAFDKFRTIFPRFATLPVAAFADRLDILKAKDFIVEKADDDGTRLYPAEKTLRIAYIY
jgi:hypothetical protein